MNSFESINIKLIQGLNLLSDSDFNKFTDFSSSKYFSGARDYKKLLEALKKMHVSGFKNYNNQTLIKHLEEILKMNKNTILNRMSELYKIFEKFVVNEFMNNNKDKKTFLLLHYYLEKKSFKLFDYVMNSFKSELENEKTNGKKIETDIRIKELSSSSNFRLSKFALSLEEYSQKSDLQIYNLILKTFKDNIEFQQQKLTGVGDYSGLSDLVLKNLPLEDIWDRLKNFSQEYYNLLIIFYNIYLSFHNFNDTKHFKMARSLHSKIKASLNRDENHHIYSILITYCINQTNLHKNEFYVELYNIIDEKLKDGYFDELKTPNIPVNNFRDYVIIGLRANKKEWVKQFIKDYSVYLPVQYRQDDIHLANGLIAIQENKYEEAIEILSKVKKRNYIHYLDSSFNMLKAFYHLKMFYDAFKEIDKITEYFSRSRNIPQKFINLNSESLKEYKLLLKYAEKKSEYDNLFMYCKKVNFKMKSMWMTEEIKKIFKAEITDKCK